MVTRLDMVGSNAEDASGTVPRPSFSGSRHRAVCQMVLAVSPDAARPGGVDGRRGLGVDHSTIGRCVLRYAPKLQKRFAAIPGIPNVRGGSINEEVPNINWLLLRTQAGVVD